MNQNNRYFYDYPNGNRPKKEDKCCPIKNDRYYHMKEDKHCQEKKDVKCCCKFGIKRSAEILGDDRIRNLINFNAAAFISDFFLVGTELTPLLPTENDNLGTLTGSLDKLIPCECDLLEISGPLTYPDVIDESLLSDLTNLLGVTIPSITTSLNNILALINSPGTTTDLSGLVEALLDAIEANSSIDDLTAEFSRVFDSIVLILTSTVTTTRTIVTDLIASLISALITAFSSQATVDANAELASLCAIKAIALEVSGTNAVLQVANYNAIKEAVRCFKCKEEDCNPKCDDCCCGNGIISELGFGNLSGRVSLTAGSLVLQNVEILGCIGNALILGAPFVPATPPAPAVNAKIYVVCAEAVQFIL